MAATKELWVNGTRRTIRTEGDPSLLSVIRDELDLTGTKYGCGEGQCGACTVLIDGDPVRSCLMKADKAAGKKVTTIEGLEGKPRQTAEGTVIPLHPVQQAFLDTEALQCGYCTSGMIMSAVALLQKRPNPSNEEIVRYMDGNVCRCGTYPRIMEAIRRASKQMKGGSDE